MIGGAPVSAVGSWRARLARPACALAGALLVLAAQSLTADAQPSASAARAFHGTVISKADSGAIFAAVVRTSAGVVIARADQNGQFVVNAGVGDTLDIRALGFRARRAVIASGAQTIALDVAPTVLPTYTTTVGQRSIRAGEATTRPTVVDKADLDGAAAISANQLLRQIPGLQELPSPPSKTSIAIRGFDDSKVLVLVDGEPVAGGLIENRDIGRLSTVAAERIEVTKGPSSVEFGSDALGGVINLVTAAPSKPFLADAIVRQGELGRRESTLGLSQTLGAFGYRVSGGWRQLDRVTGVATDGPTLERVYDLRSTLRYRASNRLSLRLDAQGASERQRWPLGGGYNGFIDDLSGQGFVEAQLNALGGMLRGRAFAQRFNYQYRQAQGLLPIAGSGDTLEQHERLERYLLAYSRSAGRQTIDVGTQYSQRTLIAPTKVDNDSAADNVAEAFARDSWTFGPVLATAGARYSSSSLWGHSLNPSVGLAWQAAPSWRLRGNVARGFRAPSFKEIRYTFSNPSAGYTIEGNPKLRPESSVSSSLGASWAPAPHFLFDVEGYRNSVSDLIDTRYQGTNAAGFIVYQSVNVAQARTQGVESSIQYLDGPWDVSAGYDYLHSRDEETGLPLSRRATSTARTHVARTWGVRSGLTTDFTARYTGASDVIGTVADKPAIVARQGSFLSLDTQLRLNVTRMAEVSAGVNNLLDQRPALYTPAFARQYFLALHLKWSEQP